jgi:phosphoglycerol transferase MdoB-like AlkP superfamily enzyme
VHQLPKLTKSFESEGYGTSFLFGGQLIYGNIKGYILNSGFDKITEGENFEESYAQGRLGVHDEGLFKKLLEQQNSYKEPFLSGAFTGSTHSPFDHPKLAKHLEGGGDYNAFINSVHYADSCLYHYIQEAKKQPWYENTVFIMLADHSHPTPNPFKSSYAPGYRKIPFLIFGEPLKEEFKGVKNHRLMTQSDIAATILGQLDIPYNQFKWSTNVYNPYAKEFVYYGFDDGLGWLSPDNYFVYQSWDKDLANKGYIDEKYAHPESKDSIRTLGESYLEVLYQEYLDY